MLAVKAGLVVTGGLLLGMVLGDAANPTMKLAPESEWRSAVPAYGGADPWAQPVREIVPFGGFAAESDAVVAEGWPTPSHTWWGEEPLQLYAEGYDDPRAWGEAVYAGYDPIAASPEADRAADAAERTAEDAELAAAQALPPEPVNAEGRPGIW